MRYDPNYYATFARLRLAKMLLPLGEDVSYGCSCGCGGKNFGSVEELKEAVKELQDAKSTWEGFFEDNPTAWGTYRALLECQQEL